MKSTVPVGSYPPNPWGLHDMSGNVWEWCWDWYAPYKAEAATDPTGPTEGAGRVLRGGCWHYKPAYVRSAARYKDRPDKVWDLLGLRLVVSSN